MEAACGFIIMALISKPRRLAFIQRTTKISIMIEQTTMPILSEVKTVLPIEIFQYPKISGSALFFGPNHHNKACEPIKLIARVPIMPLTVKFGLS